MSAKLLGAIETGGTKILARICEPDSGETVAEGRWETGSAEQAADDLTAFLSGKPLAAIGIAAFGPLIVDPASPHFGRMLATPKPGWTDSNLRSILEKRLGVPVAVDTDVNAAAVAEQILGAGQGCSSVAYVTVGTGIGAGLAIEGKSLKGALHPEAGHLLLKRRPDDEVASGCPFHADCAEGLVAGRAIRERLGEGRALADHPAVAELVADYLGQLAAALVLTWSPHRIVWGGGVIANASLEMRIGAAMRNCLGGYGVGAAVNDAGFCARATLRDAGLEGALLMARSLVGSAED